VLATLAPAIKAVPRSGRAGPDAVVALSDAISHLASRTSPDSPGSRLGRLAAVPTGRSEAAARLHGPDAAVALRLPGKPLRHRFFSEAATALTLFRRRVLQLPAASPLLRLPA
jgi:hypothetical protein